MDRKKNTKLDLLHLLLIRGIVPATVFYVSVTRSLAFCINSC